MARPGAGRARRPGRRPTGARYAVPPETRRARSVRPCGGRGQMRPLVLPGSTGVLCGTAADWAASPRVTDHVLPRSYHHRATSFTPSLYRTLLATCPFRRRLGNLRVTAMTSAE